MFEITYVQRVKAPVSSEEYEKIKKMLLDAQSKFKDYIPTIELEKSKASAKIKNQIQYVADQEGINVKVTRRKNQLLLKFSGQKVKSTRMSDDDAAEIVLNHMKKEGKIFARGELAKALDMTPVKVSRALKLLVGKKKVVSEGNMPKIKYRAK
ncbi:MAG: hypothetical protein KC713_06340 [Candidatus Omnitrophica bacterium]|nr:hypothetical protein [Candidatus Omnitrophota bacterium]